MWTPRLHLTSSDMLSAFSHWRTIISRHLSRLPTHLAQLATHLPSHAKHLLHCIVFISFILAFEITAGGIPILPDIRKDNVSPWEDYGPVLTVVLYFIRILTLLPLPIVIFQFCGLLFYNAFPPKPTLKSSLSSCPFLCIRVVTRGDYPDLVKRNVLRNLNTCLDLGLERFIIEIATDKAIGVAANPRVREIVVPTDYSSTRGAMFKARALQYCLEDDVNMLNADDFILHLDEETIMTDAALRGVINFATDGTADLGQGLITYANEEVVNWLTTLADMVRIGDDMGRLRFQFRYFHSFVLNWKGSYVVTRCSAERAVSFDNGPNGSVAEDCYFALKASSMGYRFGWVEGEMWEKSPFTMWDFLQQRKRWIQGMYLCAHCPEIAWRIKYGIAFSIYAWLTLPLTSSNIILAALYPIPCPLIMDFLVCLAGAVQLYLYIFGVMKSFSIYRVGISRFVLYTVFACCTVPFNLIIENVAVIWGIVGYKRKFYVVKKELKPPIEV